MALSGDNLMQTPAQGTGLIQILDLSDYEQGALNELMTQWRLKRPRNNIREAFYDMKNSDRQLMGPNTPLIIRNRRFVLGWSAMAVDKLNRRCNLDSFYDAGGNDLSSLGLDDVVRDNRLMAEIPQAGLASLINCTAFLVTTQGDTKAGEPPVLITAKSAADSTGLWDTRQRMITSFLSINEYDEDGEPIDMTMYLPNLNVMMEKNSANAWVVTRSQHKFGVPVDHMPYQPRLGRPFGSSRISRSVMSLHLQALAVMIRADVNGEAYSLPRYALLGATEEVFQNADGSPKPAWQAAWDSIWALPDDPDALQPRADVKQFQGQSPEPQNAHLRMLAQVFSGETSIPIGELGLASGANPTSASSHVEGRDDLVCEAESTTDGWSYGVGNAVTRALTMLNGGNAPTDLDIQPIWRNPVHISRAEAADAGAKVVASVPWLAETDVGLELLGLSGDQARRALQQRQRARGLSVLESLSGNGNA